MTKLIIIILLLGSTITCRSIDNERTFLRSNGFILNALESSYLKSQLLPVLNKIGNDDSFYQGDRLKIVLFYPELLRRNVIVIKSEEQGANIGHFAAVYKNRKDFRGYYLAGIEEIRTGIYSNQKINQLSTDIIDHLQNGDTTSKRYGLDICTVNVIVSYRQHYWYFDSYQFDSDSGTSLDKTLNMLIKEIENEFKELSLSDECQ